MNAELSPPTPETITTSPDLIQEGANVEILRSLVLQAVREKILGQQTATDILRWLESSADFV